MSSRYIRAHNYFPILQYVSASSCFQASAARGMSQISRAAALAAFNQQHVDFHVHESLLTLSRSIVSTYVLLLFCMYCTNSCRSCYVLYQIAAVVASAQV